MEKSECLEVGRISKTFGYKGTLIISIRTGFDDCIQDEGSVFIEIDEELVPFFIAEFEDDGDNFYRVRFEEFETVEEAKAFAGSPVYLPKEVIPEEILKSYLYLDIEGYAVEDSRFGDIGKVSGIIEMPTQLVLKVMHGKKEILIPYVSEMIVKTDHKNKKIILKTPDGLIDAYL
jgi:16S rRNA processing protein RimM